MVKKKAGKKAPKRAPSTVTHTREDGTTKTLAMPPAPRARAGVKLLRPRGDDRFDGLLKVKMPAAELEAVRRLAAHQTKTPSAVVRELIARELAAAFPVAKKAVKPKVSA